MHHDLIISFLLFVALVDYISSFFFFFNDTATTEIYTLSLHDALPIFSRSFKLPFPLRSKWIFSPIAPPPSARQDRKSTRLNSSHGYISYAVFCLKKKKTNIQRSPGLLYIQTGQRAHYDAQHTTHTVLA